MLYEPFSVYSLLSVRRLYTVHHTTFTDGFSFPGERHDFWEFSYFISGSAGCTSNDTVYLCRPGDAVLHAPNQYHTFWVNENNDCEIFTVAFDGTGFEHRLTAGQYRLTEEETRSVFGMLTELQRLFKNENTTDFGALLREAAPNNVSCQVVKSHLELICLSLARRGSDQNGKPLSDENSLCYAKIVAFLRDHVEEKLTLPAICRGVYESPAKIKEIFHRFTNGGVMHFYNQLRCEHIIRLLSEGRSVKDIADRMHFSSPYYLSHFFKRETGTTPREYKKRLTDNAGGGT